MSLDKDFEEILNSPLLEVEEPQRLRIILEIPDKEHQRGFLQIWIECETQEDRLWMQLSQIVKVFPLRC